MNALLLLLLTTGTGCTKTDTGDTRVVISY